MRARRLRRFVRFASILFAAVLGAAPAPAAVIDVGSGAGCETSSFEQAVALAALSAEADEIRLSSAGGDTTTVSQPIVLNSFGPGGSGALTVSGGWSSCLATVPSIAEFVLSFEGSGGPFVQIGSGGGAASEVTFRRIALTSPVGGPASLGVRLSGGSTLTLDRSRIQRFASGGVELTGGAELLVGADSAIEENGPRPDGGGVHCTGAASRVVLDGSVTANQATRGGGLFATSGCALELGPTALVAFNQATFGGGIAAVSGGQVASDAGASVDENEAATSGGALFAQGVATHVELASARLRFNRAGLAGGAIYADAGATVTMERASCAVGDPLCASQLASNELLPGGQHGAAATAAGGARVDLRQTFVTSNLIDPFESDGSVLHATGAGSEIRAESVVLARNLGPRRVVRADAGGRARLAYSTVAYNRYEDLFGPIEAYALRAVGGGSSAHVYSSVFFPTSGFQIAPEVTDLNFDCVVVQSTLGLPPTATHVTATAPLYVSTSTSNTNLELRPHSPAVDYCGTALAAPSGPDILGRARGYDLPSNPNGNPGVPGGSSVHDLGAYELRELFADGFETGGAARWSASVP